MAAIFLLSSSLSFCLLVQCVGSKSTYTMSTPAGDEVSLLQGQVEMRKSQVRDAKRTAAAEKAEYSVEESCSGSVKVASPPGLGHNEGITADPTGSAKMSDSGVHVTATPEPEMSESSLVRGVLEILACLLVADVLRRCAFKERNSSASPAQIGQTNSMPALLAAAMDGDEASFEKALIGVSAAQLQEVDKWGCTALHYAAKGGSPSIVRRLIDSDLQVEAIDACDETPLHLAARAGNAAVCKALLAAGACIDATNVEEYTPLVVAGQASQAGVCSLLIDRGASVAGLDEQEVPSLVSVLMAQKTHQ